MLCGAIVLLVVQTFGTILGQQDGGGAPEMWNTKGRALLTLFRSDGHTQMNLLLGAHLTEFIFYTTPNYRVEVIYI